MSESISANAKRESLMPNREARARLRRIRRIKDGLSRYGVMSAGIAVVFSLGLIFFYLFSEIAPLFRGASVEPVSSYSLQKSNDSLAFVSLERYEEVGAAFYASGAIEFFDAKTGAISTRAAMPAASDAQFTAIATSTANQALIAYGYSDGSVSVAKPEYALSYPNDQRAITPSITFPLGDAPIQLDVDGKPLRHVAIQHTTNGWLIAALTDDRRLLLGRFDAKRNLLTGKTHVEQDITQLPSLPDTADIVEMQLDDRAKHLVIATKQSGLILVDITDPQHASIREGVSTGTDAITDMTFLVGTGSVVVGTDTGRIEQWLLVRNEQNVYHLVKVREFEKLKGAINTLSAEYARRGFWAADDQGTIGIYFATSHRTLLIDEVGNQAFDHLAISPINGHALLTAADGNTQLVSVWNKHPEVSFTSLWTKVWYEGRDAPDYIWQASSGSDNFEAKMSFVPLSIGTLKAAFFAILFAVPLGVAGAIYTAYFMTPKLRGVVKPAVEIMAALPTVILGFIAGLWLAPFIENHLPAIFSILILLPVVMLVTGFAWSRLPSSLRDRTPQGWEAFILVVPIILTIWFCVAMSPVAETTFFDGSMRQWFTDNGITYDQRNALIVGLIMGFAVIPTIFSIAEDAVFSVPRHLTQGSLALGATPWQTMVGVVLPTASPGIFSAVMMGFGRAVGETMIVLMATGNSPVVNFNIFEGMRTLSANIAVELPETAVGSTHFRVLFLAALVLLALTFVVNTLAEVIRQRLRQRYSNL